MRVKLGQVRALIKEAIDCWGGSQPEETYKELLESDPSYAKKSVLVPDDVKASISKWLKAMGLG